MWPWSQYEPVIVMDTFLAEQALEIALPSVLIVVVAILLIGYPPIHNAYHS